MASAMGAPSRCARTHQPLQPRTCTGGLFKSSLSNVTNRIQHARSGMLKRPSTVVLGADNGTSTTAAGYGMTLTMNGVSVMADMQKMKDELQELKDKAKRHEVLFQEHFGQPPERDWGFLDFCWDVLKAIIYVYCCVVLASAASASTAAFFIIGLCVFLVWRRNKLTAAKRQNDKMPVPLMKSADAKA